MMTHGLSPNWNAADGHVALPPEVPALRIDLRTRGIVEVSSALSALTGLDAGALIGRLHGDLWPAPERAAIDRRLDDVVLLGHDAFGCLAFTPAGAAPLFVEVAATYRWPGDHGIELALRPLAGSRAPAAGPLPEPPAAAPTPPPTTVAASSLGASEPSARPGAATVPDVDIGFAVMSALTAAGAAALAVDAEDRVASATPEVERLLGMPIARLRGQRLADILALADVADAALAAARAGAARQCVAATLASDGRQVAVEWVPGTGPREGYVVLVEDRPESEDAERQRLQARLVSFVAHDVRNSLAAVYCGLRSLGDVTAADDPKRATVDKALAEIQRASRIVDDVLEVSRPGSMTRVPLGIATVLGETLNRFRPRAAARGVEIVERLDASVRVLADLSQLERAFANLVENALDAMPHAGILTVAVRVEDRGRPGVCVEIGDTGVGIVPDLRANVFEPFVTAKPGGTGLGLAITRRIVLDHEGQIDLASELGRGTTFNVWLPRL